MGQQGITLVETLLAVVILFFLSSTIIPLTYNMKQQIAVQKVQAHAAEAAFIGALKYARYGEYSGIQQIDDTLFSWVYDGSHICVMFEADGLEEELCV
ncbi:pilus assembly FimT family protein [Solibacillus silvestris]|uniref:pilus assembly FimT family protein n=1 Tax=Solibacillus silvestris TaxID=76853 RepID=UPI003F81B417